MVTTIIGKIFLQAYNKKYCEKNGKELTPKEFFTDIFYPLFFGHDKYLMWIQNSEMVQGLKKGATLTSEEIERRKNRCIEKIENAIIGDASIAVGYRAESLCTPTSGQIDIYNTKISPDDAYLSWIGAGLGVGVQGSNALSILFSEPQILLDLYEGWSEYRDLLNSMPQIKGNEITFWNGQWLKRKYPIYDDLCAHSSILSNKAKKEKEGEGEEVEKQIIGIDAVLWSELLIAISLQFEKPQLMGYVYRFDKTNITLGFIPLVLSQIRKPYELYKKFFDIQNCKLAELLGSKYAFSKACENGVVGLKALEPQEPAFIKKKCKANKELNEIECNVYKIWLLAMLNNEELWTKAEKFAEMLRIYHAGQEKDRTDRSNAIRELFEHPTQRSFVKYVTPILEENKELIEMVKLVNQMPDEKVPYFIHLVKINYIVIS